MGKEQVPVQVGHGADQPGRDLLLRPTSTPVPARPIVHRYANSTRVPLHLKTRRMNEAAPAARQHLLRVLVHLTLIVFPRSVGLGAGRVIRMWWDWVWCKEERDSARKEERLHHLMKDLREAEKKRWIGSGVTLAMAAGVLVPVAVLAPVWWWYIGAVLLVIGLARIGRRTAGDDGQVVEKQRSPSWMFTDDHLVEAFREAGLLGKEQKLRIVSPPVADGGGWVVTVDLPGARKASSVIKAKEALAAALDLDEARLMLDRDRSASGHASRLVLWASEELPFQGAPVRSPMASAESWDVWRAAPFGTDARGRTRDMSLLWSNILVGSRPGRGKSAACRVAAAPFILDPTVDVLCFDGKGGRDWAALEGLAVEYVVGSDDDDALALRDALQRLKVDAQRRFRDMRRMSSTVCPDNKITPEITSDPKWSMPITLVIVDELQNYTEAGEPGWPEKGQKATVGDNIGSLLIWLAKNGRAIGIVLMLATQRPGSTSLPTDLRAQMGIRFGLNMTDWQGSDMILGPGKRELGHDCSRLLSSWLGVGILVPDGEQGDADTGCPTLRTHYLAGHEWNALCKRGQVLRQGRGPRLTIVRDEDQDVVDAEVVPEFLEQVLACFTEAGKTVLSAAKLAAIMGISKDRLVGLMSEEGIEPRRTSEARGYRRSDVEKRVTEGGDTGA